MSRRLGIAIAASFAAVLAAGGADAQQAVVTGQVVDARTGEPVAGASVHVDDGLHGAVSDARGNFRVTRVVRGQRTVWASAPGYALAGGPLLVAGDSAAVELALDPEPVRLDPIVATTSRLEARRRAYPRSVRVLDERQIQASAAPNARDLLEMRFGLRPTACNAIAAGQIGNRRPRGPVIGMQGSGCATVRGHAAAPAVFVDEVRWPSGMDLLSTYQLTEIARVEVFGGGEEVRVYTRWFLDWAARNNVPLWPILLSDH